MSEPSRTPAAGADVTTPPRTWEGSPLSQAKRVVIDFLQSLFELADRGKCHWDADPKQSEIYIGPIHPMNPEEIARRPALIVYTSPARALNLTIDTYEGDNPLTGEVTYSDLFSSTLGIDCVSSVSEEAEWLSWVVDQHIWLLKNVLRQSGFFEIGRLGTFGAAQVVPLGHESLPIFYQATVAFPFYFQMRYTITPPPVSEVDKLDVKIEAVSTTEGRVDDDPYTVRLVIDEDSGQDAGSG